VFRPENTFADGRTAPKTGPGSWRRVKKPWWMVLVLVFCITVFCITPARGQKFDVTPLVGGMFGGTVQTQQENTQGPTVRATLSDSFSFGVAAGFRFEGDDVDLNSCEDCSLVEFRWVRRLSNLNLQNTPLLLPTPLGSAVAQPSVTIDHFLGDFTHEWVVEANGTPLRPFLTASLGAAHMGTPQAGQTRFAFGFSTGMKVFPQQRWGIRFQVEYLGIVMSAGAQQVICAGGCIVVLDGGVMNQFQVSAGPIFRF
jgi:hypothetical protein